MDTVDSTMLRVCSLHLKFQQIQSLLQINIGQTITSKPAWCCFDTDTRQSFRNNRMMVGG